MDLKDFTDLGNDIGRRVNDAIYNMNFDQLNRDIRNKVDQAFYGGRGTDSGFNGLDGKLYHGDDSYEEQQASFKQAQESKGFSKTADLAARIPIAKKTPGKISGLIMMILGWALAGAFGAAGIVTGLLGLTMTSVGAVPAGVLGAVAGGMAPLFLAGLILAVIGTKKFGRCNRFKKYLSILQNRDFCNIKELAQRTAKSPRFVARDLQRMIDKGFFTEGHIDDHKTCFIGTNATYAQYIQARDSAAACRESSKKTVSQDTVGETVGDEQLKQVIEEGNSYIQTIREANDAIYDQGISEKLYRMERIVKKIFQYVEQNPDQVDQLRRFMSYYMPTTEKLVNAYRQMDEQSVQGETMIKAKSEIAQTLDTINEAYEKLYDSMYVDVAMDVSSDIAVLKTLFAQEGLTENEINGGKKG